MDASGLSNTRKAAKLAVYEATMIIAKPAHTIPSTRALKLRGVPNIKEERENYSKNDKRCSFVQNFVNFIYS